MMPSFSILEDHPSIQRCRQHVLGKLPGKHIETDIAGAASVAGPDVTAPPASISSLEPGSTGAGRLGKRFRHRAETTSWCRWLQAVWTAGVDRAGACGPSAADERPGADTRAWKRTFLPLARKQQACLSGNHCIAALAAMKIVSAGAASGSWIPRLGRRWP